MDFREPKKLLAVCVSNKDRSPQESTAETQPQVQPALLDAWNEKY